MSVDLWGFCKWRTRAMSKGRGLKVGRGLEQMLHSSDSSHAAAAFPTSGGTVTWPQFPTKHHTPEANKVPVVIEPGKPSVNWPRRVVLMCFPEAESNSLPDMPLAWRQNFQHWPLPWPYQDILLHRDLSYWLLVLTASVELCQSVHVGPCWIEGADRGKHGRDDTASEQWRVGNTEKSQVAVAATCLHASWASVP